MFWVCEYWLPVASIGAVGVVLKPVFWYDWVVEVGTLPNDGWLVYSTSQTIEYGVFSICVCNVIIWPLIVSHKTSWSAISFSNWFISPFVSELTKEMLFVFVSNLVNVLQDVLNK